MVSFPFKGEFKGKFKGIEMAIKRSLEGLKNSGSGGLNADANDTANHVILVISLVANASELLHDYLTGGTMGFDIGHQGARLKSSCPNPENYVSSEQSYMKQHRKWACPQPLKPPLLH